MTVHYPSVIQIKSEVLSLIGIGVLSLKDSDASLKSMPDFTISNLESFYYGLVALTSLYKGAKVFPGIEFFALIFFVDNCQPLATVLLVIYK